MIDTIVFDIGNVLATFNPKEFLHTLFQDEVIESKIYSILFTDLWNFYDQGIYSRKDLINICSQIDRNLEKEIELVLINWVKYVLPIESSMELIQKYKDSYSIYILSNIPEDMYLYLWDHYDFLQQVNGGIYSYQHKIIKPDPNIFNLLLNTYNLNAEQCLFIDDSKKNVEVAQSLHMHAIWLEDYRKLPEIMEDYLNEM